MIKLLIVSLACVALFGQISFARDVTEALNNNLREQLKGYETFLANDDGTHKEDLKKLIEITENALKSESADEKQSILNSIQQHFTPEFNTYISEKLEEFQVNDDIHDAIQFYNSLTESHPEFKDEIEKTVAKLENLLKETNLKQKEESFLNLNKDFTPEFQKFLKDNALPNINRELQKTAEFFENLLVGSDVKFETEIKALKTQTEAALAPTLSVDEKQNALQKVTNPENRELYEYLQKKFIELN